MRHRPCFAALFGSVALACALGCSGDPSSGTGGTTSTGGSGGVTGGGGAGGDSLPPLDPAACPITADSGADTALSEAAESQFVVDFALPESSSVQQDKAFFLATLFGADSALLAELTADPDLAAMSQDRDDRLRGAPDACATDVACYVGALGWSADEAAAAADALVAKLTATGALAALAQSMRASGRFALFATVTEEDLVHGAFTDMTVALGKTLSEEAASLGGSALHDTVQSVADSHPAPFVFFEPLLAVDLAALTADQRDEATRYEPLAKGENEKALLHIPDIDFAQYPFTTILVPGQGPDNPEDHLAPDGQKRADLAAQRFVAKIAPLIALSGGHVHPDRTPYSEAIEMKKYLVSTYSIPEEAILIDPHARHTTTNLRNVTRLLYRYGVPTDRPVLVTTTFGQALYIGFWHGTFGPRCMDELGYLPWSSLVSISDNDACMRPVALSLHADGRDALDP